MNKKKYANRVNQDLRYERIINLIDENGKLITTTFNNAIKIADRANLDLVEVGKKDNSPLCKMMDYEKFIYNKNKKAKANKNNKQVCKEIRLSANISDNDLQIKARACEKFINNGDKVKVVLNLKGRENANKEFYQKSIFDFIVKCEEFSIPESLPSSEGNKFIVYLKKKK